jgi:hypothetical protein
MHVCDRCGATGAREVTGRRGRIEWLKSSFQSASEERRPAIADRIMDEIQERDRFLCEPCTTCGCCYLTSEGLAECAICRAPVCADCSLPAVRVDDAGKIIEGSDDGKVLCSRCNPPSGGRNAGLQQPTPVTPLCVV